MNSEPSREQFASRLGFILMTAGCAIGLGNVWRFPYITGQYGGGLFVFLYLFFLAVLGFPVMMMELSLGRAGRSTFPGAFRNLQNKNVRFSLTPVILQSGNSGRWTQRNARHSLKTSLPRRGFRRCSC